MRVTEVRVNVAKNGTSTLKAYASINLDGVFAVNNLTVKEGRNGLFVSMPQRKGKDKDGNDKYFDIAFPVTAELRKEISDAVIAEYNEVAGVDTGTTSSDPVQNTPTDEDDPFAGLQQGW